MNVAERARSHSWYHTVELGPGQVTDGEVDLRPHVPKYGLPRSMEGMRALDIGAFDGFWSFEMERRGARVTAIDVASDRELDWPASRQADELSGAPRGETFAIAREALGSHVERETVSVYEATPERLGTFDLVFCGSVLIHLRDPVLALERIGRLCTGTFISGEGYHPWLSRLPFALAHYRALRESSVVFWEPNVKAWRRMIESAGFSAVEEKARFRLASGRGWKVPHVIHHARR